MPVVCVQIHRTNTVSYRFAWTSNLQYIRRWYGRSFGGLVGVGHVIPGRRRILALGDKSLDQALQVIDPLTHPIGVAAAVGTRSRGVLGSAELTRSLLAPSCAVLAGLLPITLESEMPSVTVSLEQVAHKIGSPLAYSLSGATGVTRQGDAGPPLTPTRLVRGPGGQCIPLGIHVGINEELLALWLIKLECDPGRTRDATGGSGRELGVFILSPRS